MYGLLALGFYVTYAVSGTVNFAQGSSMMLGAVLAYAFAQTLGWPMLAAIALALVLCALYGLVVEVVAVRPFVRRGSDAWLMATVALGIVLDNVVMFTFGKEPRSLPSSLAVTPIDFGGVGVGVYPLQLAHSGRRARDSPRCCTSSPGARAGASRCSRWCRTATPRA